MRSNSYLLGLPTLTQMKHLFFTKIFLNALHRIITFLCDSMTTGTICRWGHFILLLFIGQMLYCLLRIIKYDLREIQLCGHWKDIRQHSTRWISEMKCLYFITFKMFDRVESWLDLLCFWPVRHFSLMEMLKQLLWKGNSHYFFFFCCRNANFSLYLNLKWEMNDLVLYSILVAMYQSYAELVWTDSSSFFLSMAEENGVDCAAVILQTWLNFSVYLWVSTNTLCILLPCIECFYFPLI